jgi:hypothetical protein
MIGIYFLLFALTRLELGEPSHVAYPVMVDTTQRLSAVGRDRVAP